MHHDRVELFPEVPRRGQEVNIKYKGILYQNGADALWLHYGFDDWKNTNIIQMQRERDHFTCKIKADGRKDINFCFKDSADHWDNNRGLNWSCNIK
ncbi:MAG: carbohydrate-binding protein [Dethiobacteria bacterium]|jgi:hypothetical protein